MKILFIGEYSNVFTELSKELRWKGHDTFSVSDGDLFKKYPADYLIVNEVIHKHVVAKLLRYVSYRLGLSGLIVLLKQWNTLKKHIKGYDVVQLINPVALTGFGSIANLILLRYVYKHNKSVYLSALGDDYYIVDWFIKNDKRSNYYRTSFLKNIINPGWAAKYKYCLFYKSLNDYAIKISNAIIPGLDCYRDAYLWTGKVSKIVPFPISKEKYGFPITIKDSEAVVIFHGWQKGREARKGNDVYDRVIKKVVEKFGGQVRYEVVQSVPFSEYIKLFSSAHIFIDQLYFEECGYNGLLGLAAGKVVFSGFNPNCLHNYPIYKGSEIGVFASLQEYYLYNQFCEIIKNKNRIEEISRNALDFVKDNHLSDIVCERYLSIWKNTGLCY